MSTKAQISQKFTPRQQRFVDLVAAGRTQRQAALEVGISEHTGSRWMQEPRFKKLLQERSCELWRATENGLTGITNEAIQALSSILRNENAAEGAKVSAARSVLEFALKFRELGTLAERLAELEDRALQVKES